MRALNSHALELEFWVRTRPFHRFTSAAAMALTLVDSCFLSFATTMPAPGASIFATERSQKGLVFPYIFISLPLIG